MLSATLDHSDIHHTQQQQQQLGYHNRNRQFVLLDNPSGDSDRDSVPLPLLQPVNAVVTPTRGFYGPLIGSQIDDRFRQNLRGGMSCRGQTFKGEEFQGQANKITGESVG